MPIKKSHLYAFLPLQLKTARKIAYINNMSTETLLPTQRGTDWLTAGGVRPTKQRVSLATLLVGDGQNRHVTAEGLYEAASKSGEGCLLRPFTTLWPRFVMRG